MLRNELPPPAPVGRLLGAAPADVAAAAGPRARLTAAPPPPAGGSLGEASPAAERRRPLFHPRRGWLRRTERAVSHWLTARWYPRIPGLHLPYERVLARTMTLSSATIPLPGLAPPLDGLRLLLVTDVHAGPFVRPATLRRTFQRLRAVEADAILLGGDLVSARVEELRDNLDAFRALRAPLGVFAVLGNHDHYTGRPGRIRELLESCGIAVLHNRSTRVGRGAARLSLAGVDDSLMGAPDLDAALAGATPPVVLLSHNPDLLFQASRRGVALMLAGHTHGGQVRLPGLPVLVRQSRYRLDAGRYRFGGTELVVSVGLGAVGIPWRAACPPEAVLLTLARPAPRRG